MTMRRKVATIREIFFQIVQTKSKQHNALVAFFSSSLISLVDELNYAQQGIVKCQTDYQMTHLPSCLWFVLGFKEMKKKRFRKKWKIVFCWRKDNFGSRDQLDEDLKFNYSLLSIFEWKDNVLWMNPQLVNEKCCRRFCFKKFNEPLSCFY